MSGTLMLVNPRKRRAKKARSPAQRAATKRMLAANRAKRRSNPAPRRRARRSATHAVAHSYRRRARRANPAPRHHYRRHRRHNPISVSSLKIGQLIKVGAVGAAGALVVDIAMGFVGGFLPASVSAAKNADGSVNYLNAATKLGVAVLVGSLGRKVFKRHAATMAVGAVTVELYNLIKPMLASAMPSLGLGYYSPAYLPGQTIMAGQGLGAYVPAGMPAPVKPAALGAYVGAYGSQPSPYAAGASAMNRERASYVR